MSTPRRDKATANSRDRCSCRRKSWIVLRIDLPLATEPVSPRPSRLANVRYCFIRLPFILECRRRISQRIITCAVENLLLSKKVSWVLNLTKLLDCLCKDEKSYDYQGVEG